MHFFGCLHVFLNLFSYFFSLRIFNIFSQLPLSTVEFSRTWRVRRLFFSNFNIRKMGLMNVLNLYVRAFNVKQYRKKYYLSFVLRRFAYFVWWTNFAYFRSILLQYFMGNVHCIRSMTSCEFIVQIYPVIKYWLAKKIACLLLNYITFWFYVMLVVSFPATAFILGLPLNRFLNSKIRHLNISKSTSSLKYQLKFFFGFW